MVIIRVICLLLLFIFINNCKINAQDSDGDGIFNTVDLDDDNDGIPDVIELGCNGNNLLSNGDFESGNTGFTSNYTFSSDCTHPEPDEGEYMIITNPNSCHNSFQSISDHTTGGGNMMIINGGATAGEVFWQATVNVTSNTTYEFGLYLRNVAANNSNRPSFELQINGSPIISNDDIAIEDGWVYVSGTYFNASNSSLTISFVNYQTSIGENDFAIDDVHFGTCAVTDTDDDGIADYLDLDSDNDGIFDGYEAGHGQPLTNGRVTSSAGNNGLVDVLETSTDSDILNYNLLDSESFPDGIYDPYETDADEDFCFDTNEGAVSDPDDDGIAGTGVPMVNASNGLVTSIVYASPPNNYWQNPNTVPIICDTDEDIVTPLITDIDDDNDGIVDEIEAAACLPAQKTVELNFFFEDFGAGLSVVSSDFVQLCYEDGTDPCAISGAQVDDGEYTIADTPRKFNNNADWTGLGDHTGDLNGRMLVANADFDPDTFYIRPINGFIKNVPVTASFWVRNTIIPGSNILKPDITASISSSTGAILGSLNTGDIPEDETWHQFSVSANPGNENIVYLVLRNNGPGGGGNDLALDDISFSQFVCDNDADGIANHLDLDSDNDGIYDIIEAEGVDTNGDGVADGNVDTDGDGVPDYADPDHPSCTTGDVNLPTDDICDDVQGGPDMDGDGIQDADDFDTDGDGLANTYDPDNNIQLDAAGDCSGNTLEYNHILNFSSGTTDANADVSFTFCVRGDYGHPTNGEGLTVFGEGSTNLGFYDEDDVGLDLEDCDDRPLCFAITISQSNWNLWNNDGMVVLTIIPHISVNHCSDYSCVLSAKVSYTTPGPGVMISNPDTDTDGVFDTYDSDADGDGCFDTEEEAIPDVDNDGIAGTGSPTVNSKGLVTSIAYMSPPNNVWQNSLIGPCLTEICNDGLDNDSDGLIDCYDCDACASFGGCLDSDADGIGDLCDLDDDNDGIPDLEECPSLAYDTLDWSTETYTAGATSQGYTIGGHNINISVDDPAGTLVSIPPQLPFVASYYQGDEVAPDHTLLYSSNISTLGTNNSVTTTIDLGVPGEGLNNFSFSLFDLDGELGTFYRQEQVIIEGTLAGAPVAWSMYTVGIMVRSNDTITAFDPVSVTGVGTENGVVDIVFDSPVDQVTFSFKVAEGSNIVPGSTPGFGLHDLRFNLPCDSDNDGIYNSLDLDSDNDGIFDLDEAGHSAVDANNDGIIDGIPALFGTNGLLNTLETTANSGIINYNLADSESTPNGIFDPYELDSDGDGCFDTEEENVSDTDTDGIAGTGIPTVNPSSGLVTTITYTAPPNNHWQNPLVGPCLTEICNDGIDNDSDGDIDNADADCCGAQAPTLTKD